MGVAGASAVGITQSSYRVPSTAYPAILLRTREPGTSRFTWGAWLSFRGNQDPYAMLCLPRFRRAACQAMAMIDMHSHILPGIDDGAADAEEALQMLRLAAANGVRVQVLTPHIHSGRYDNTLASLRTAFEAFRCLVREQRIPIELRLAAEVRIGAEVLQSVGAGRLPWLGEWYGRRVLLLEFPHSLVPIGSENLVAWLMQQQIVPMIAHPERNRGLQADRSKLEPFLAAGCLLQITSDSLTGGFGPVAREFAIDLLRTDKVTVLATDCHNLAFRPPALSQGYRCAIQWVGQRAADDLVWHNPLHLLGLAEVD